MIWTSKFKVIYELHSNKGWSSGINILNTSWWVIFLLIWQVGIPLNFDVVMNETESDGLRTDQ